MKMEKSKSKSSKLKGKTYEEIYGSRAEEIKAKHSVSMKGKNVGKNVGKNNGMFIGASPLLPSEILQESIKRCEGFVYFALKLGYVKIGCTKIDPADRVKRLQTSHPLDVEAELIYFIPANNRYEKEKEFHKYFSDKRVRGEWFALTEEDIRIIKDGEV